MAATSWATRIPAANAKARRLLGDRPERIFLVESNGSRSVYVTLTAGEVALAKALWEFVCGHGECELSCCVQGRAALIAFCEKMEALDD